MVPGLTQRAMHRCTVRGRLLKAVHDEHGLFRSVDIESRAQSGDLDFHLRPLTGDHIGVGFILSWGVRPEFLPPESGYGDDCAPELTKRTANVNTYVDSDFIGPPFSSFYG